MENSRNKQLISFKLCATLSSVMKSPTLDMNYPLAQGIHAIHAAGLTQTSYHQTAYHRIVAPLNNPRAR